VHKSADTQNRRTGSRKQKKGKKSSKRSAGAQKCGCTHTEEWVAEKNRKRAGAQNRKRRAGTQKEELGKEEMGAQRNTGGTDTQKEPGAQNTKRWHNRRAGGTKHKKGAP
jgi:hypothetical protein